MKNYELQEDNFIEKIPGKQIDLTSLKFKTGNTLIIDKKNGELRLLNRAQELQLTISVHDEGLVLNMFSSKININATDELNLSGKKININALEQVNIRTEGNLVQQVGKDALSEVAGVNKMIAAVQKLTATLGNVDIKANDDIRLDGERVKLNCD